MRSNRFTTWNKEVLAGKKGAWHLLHEMKPEPEMDWSQCFAQRTALMRRNAVRELLKVTSRPEIISFAGGLPAAELFPVARVKSALTTVLDRVGGQALQSSATEGLPELRDWLARQFTNGRLRVDREECARHHGRATSAGSGRPHSAGEGRPGDGGDQPTLALLSAWQQARVEFLPVRGDANGMKVEEWEPLLKRKRKAVYCVPNFQNPKRHDAVAAQTGETCCARPKARHRHRFRWILQGNCATAGARCRIYWNWTPGTAGRPILTAG